MKSLLFSLAAPFTFSLWLFPVLVVAATPVTPEIMVDPIILPKPSHSNTTAPFAKWTTIPLPSASKVSAYLVRTNQDWTIATPTKQRQLQKTLTQAQKYGCTIGASNGGPFQRDGSSSGPLVLQGKILNNATTDFVGFGTSVQNEWILGNYHQFQNTNTTILDFVTGFDWLVYDGKVVAKKEDDMDNPTGATRAARTAMGLDSANRLLLLVADGCEKCLRHGPRQGLKLSELAQLLVDQGARYAINMDEGGSSTLVKHRSDVENSYQVINRPTCLDVPMIRCQRPVATVLCVRHWWFGSDERPQFLSKPNNK